MAKQPEDKLTGDIFELEPVKQPPITTWPVGLAVELADLETSTVAEGTLPLNTIKDICQRFEITEEFLETLRGVRAFRAEVHSAIAELKKGGGTAKRKAALQTEVYLDTLVPRWMNDPKFPESEKIKLLAFLAKMGRLVDDPAAKTEGANTPANQQAPTLKIILTQEAPATPMKIVQESYTTIDQVKE